MSERRLTRQAALPASPVCIDAPPLVIEPLAEGYVLCLLTDKTSAEIAARFDWLAGNATAVRTLPSETYLLVGDRLLTSEERERARADSTGFAALSEQGDGRVRIGVSGAGACDLLSRGTGADLSPDRFAQGTTLSTLYGHIGVYLTRLGPDAFEIMVLRSYADSLWRHLIAEADVMRATTSAS